MIDVQVALPDFLVEDFAILAAEQFFRAAAEQVAERAVDEADPGVLDDDQPAAHVGDQPAEALLGAAMRLDGREKVPEQPRGVAGDHRGASGQNLANDPDSEGSPVASITNCGRN